MTTRQETESTLTDLSDLNLNATKFSPQKHREAFVEIPVLAFSNVKAYANAKSALHVSSIPEKLPCREAEFSELYSLLELALNGTSGTCIYVSGVPGTGKTAIFYEVLRKLKRQARSNKLPSFKFVEINGMKVIDPSQAYTLVHDALFKNTVSARQAQRALQDYFQAGRVPRERVIVLLDEFDLLITQRQSVLYHFLEWAQHALILVAIANIMDLPERQLKKKVASRLGWVRLDFHPYTETQLLKILRARLAPWPALFQLSALEFLARKVSAIHGDARQLLMVATRALELAEAECKASHRTAQAVPSDGGAKRRLVINEKGTLAFPVTIPHIQKAWDQGHGLQSVVQALPKQYKCLLICFLQCTDSHSMGVQPFMDLFYQQSTLKNLDMEISDDLILTWLHRLASCALLSLDASRDSVSLNLTHQDLHKALKDDPDFGAWVSTMRPTRLMPLTFEK